jgi:hypothetical protein
MLSAVLPTKEPPVPSGLSECSEKDARTRFVLWLSRHNTAFTIIAASVLPILYLLFVEHYATNSFTADDWYVVPIVHAALHGQLTLGQLWWQHDESRYFLWYMIDVLFGFVDRLDLRSVIFLSAAIFIASYAGLLLLVRQYLGKRLTPIPVLVISAICFSLADVQNILWASQVPVFLTVFFFTMLVVLLVPNGRRRLWFALGVLFAVVASLASLQGFLCWPLGAICLLWNQPWGAHRVRIEIGLWLSFMVLTTALYLPGYNVDEGNVCLNHAQCTYGAILVHPGTALAFFFTLIGNVIPGTAIGFFTKAQDLIRFEVLGVVLFGVAFFILIRSWRERRPCERLPLPLLLIVFSLLVDAMTTAGRGGGGRALDYRYVLPNLILLTGIVIYGLARVPTHRPVRVSRDWRHYLKYLALFALGILLVVQVTATTGFGLTNGRSTDTVSREEAQYFVNLNRSHVVNNSPSCQIDLALLKEPDVTLREATMDQLGEFQPSSYRYYRKLGPWLPPACRKATTLR